MLGRRSDSEWERFGRQDPYYGVVTLDRFRRDKLTEEAKRDFFTSGEDHIAFVFEQVRRRLDPEFAPKRAMDFGCGVGRCTLPLATRCAEVVGVDVSKAMLEEARRNGDARALANIRYVESDDTLSKVSGSFDLIHSVITFQHIPPHRGERIFARQLEALAENGVGAVQFVHHRDVARAVRAAGWLRKRVPLLHPLLNLAAGKPVREPLVEKNCYSLSRLARLLQAHGCGHLYLLFESEGPLKSVMLFFQKKRAAMPYEAFYNQA